jgi:[ribosomal protein S18]-alanine N-acetyltransferase
MSSLELRPSPMRWWDIPSVLAIDEAVFAATAWSAAQFWGELARPNRTYVVLRDPVGEVRGYAGLAMLPPEADVQTIAVRPDVRGQGGGSILLRHLLNEARSQECTAVLLEVRADNASAIAMYERFGFTVISRRSNYYGPGSDALIMRLRPIPEGV